VAKKILSAE